MQQHAFTSLSRLVLILVSIFNHIKAGLLPLELISTIRVTIEARADIIRSLVSTKLHSIAPRDQVRHQVHDVDREDVLAEQALDLLKLGVVGETLREHVRTDHVGHRAHYRKLRIDRSGVLIGAVSSDSRQALQLGAKVDHLQDPY